MQKSDTEKGILIAASEDNFVLEKIPEWQFLKDSSKDIFVIEILIVRGC